MKIDRNNYEAYFMDYLEGNLDENVVNDFIEFIQQNPDLKEEMELVRSVSLPPEEQVFSKKTNLYRENYDREKEFNRAAIAQIEGDLNDDEKPAFEDYLSRHPEKQKEVALFSNTKLQPDESVQFSKKNKLYRHSARRSILLWSGRVAAVMVMALSVYLFIHNTAENTIENQVAGVQNETEQQEISASENSAPEKQPVTETEEQLAVSLPEQNRTEESTVQSVEEAAAKQEKTLPAENTTAETNQQRVSAERIPVEVPDRINTLSAKVKAQKPAPLLASLENYRMNPSPVETTSDERLIGDIVREKAGLDNISVNKITKAGLKLVSSFSKDNLTYETNENGKITEVNFDSRLLAFSIPTDNDDKKN